MEKLKGKDWERSGFLLVISATILLVFDPWVSRCMGDGKQGHPTTIVELQPFRETSSIEIKHGQGEDGVVSLIKLNPNINAWFLLRSKWGKGGIEGAYHIENADPQTQRPRLHKSNPKGLLLIEGVKRLQCDLWGMDSQESLEGRRKSHLPYAALCNSRLYLRNPTKGHQTPIEAATDFLRKTVPGGEEIVSFVRDTFFTYLYDEKAEKSVQSNSATSLRGSKESHDGPAPALLNPLQASPLLKPIDLGIKIHESGRSGMIPGTWYEAEDNPGIYVSVIVPNEIASEIMSSYRTVVNRLDTVELAQLVYLVAFDLSRFDLHYALGTVHPGVGWSEHIASQMKDKSLPGPDGIGTISPLVSTGLINPVDAPRTVATFTGGFKREHGAFAYGPLAQKNHGSHYGFLENGVIFSTLQSGLSTIYVLNDGWADMKTWAEEDSEFVSKVRYARQNGVPIIVGSDPVTRLSIPGPWVADWGKGNWSGSTDKKLRTMRAGAALQEFKGKRFLIYAFFWSATPSAMARVFQAYQCRYAMLLDMNALVHTYLAIYRRQGSNISVQHLIKGMSEVDMSVKGRYIPRFLGYADDRDFFYLTKKEVP
jgi:hypothetical protein